MIKLDYTPENHYGSLTGVTFEIENSVSFDIMLEHFRKFLVCCGYSDYGPLVVGEEQEEDIIL